MDMARAPTAGMGRGKELSTALAKPRPDPTPNGRFSSAWAKRQTDEKRGAQEIHLMPGFPARRR